MPSARQPAAALADRAERHVFESVPGLPAIERRALALIELAGVSVAAAATELGVDEASVRAAVAVARKALRRTLAPLAAGSRCERGERLVSDRLDAALDWRERRWLEIHLARCPRCIEHVELLDTARADLRQAFVAEPPTVEPASLEQGSEGKAQLRVVSPPAPPEPEAPEEATVGGISMHNTWKSSPRHETAEASAAAEHPTPSLPLPKPAAKPKPARAAQPKPARAAKPKPARRPTPAAKRAAKILAIVLAVAALLAGLGIGIDALTGHGKQQTAPWAQPDAPDIKPAPLSGQ